MGREETTWFTVGRTSQAQTSGETREMGPVSEEVKDRSITSEEYRERYKESTHIIVLKR